MPPNPNLHCCKATAPQDAFFTAQPMSASGPWHKNSIRRTAPAAKCCRTAGGMAARRACIVRAACILVLAACCSAGPCNNTQGDAILAALGSLWSPALLATLPRPVNASFIVRSRAALAVREFPETLTRGCSLHARTCFPIQLAPGSLDAAIANSQPLPARAIAEIRCGCARAFADDFAGRSNEASRARQYGDGSAVDERHAAPCSVCSRRRAQMVSHCADALPRLLAGMCRASLLCWRVRLASPANSRATCAGRRQAQRGFAGAAHLRHYGAATARDRSAAGVLRHVWRARCVGHVEPGV